MLISGEPGIGKSRIAQTVLERLSGEPHTRLRYFCSPHHQDSALYPIITQLERAAGFRARRHRRATAGQARGGARPGGPTISARSCRCWRTCCRSRPATAIRRSTSPRRSARRRRFAALIGAGRGAGGASAGADGVRGRALERPDLARAARPAHRPGAQPAASW